MASRSRRSPFLRFARLTESPVGVLIRVELGLSGLVERCNLRLALHQRGLRVRLLFCRPALHQPLKLIDPEVAETNVLSATLHSEVVRVELRVDDGLLSAIDLSL